MIHQSMSSAVILAVMVSGVAAEEASEREQLDAYAASFLATRDSFNRINCEYELRNLAAETEAQLLTEPGKPTNVCQGILIRKGTKVRCENNIPRAELLEIRQTARTVFSPDRFLVDGDSGITFCPALSGGVIYSPRSPPEQQPLTPFDFGRFTGAARGFHPGWLVERSDLAIQAKLLGQVRLEDPILRELFSTRTLVAVDYQFKSPDNLIRFVFHLDPESGCLPAISEFYLNDQLQQKAVITDVRDFGKGRAFPMRSLNYSATDNGNGELRIAWAIETRVIRLAIDEPVDDSLFRIDIDKLSVYRDAADDDSQFKLEGMQSLSLADVPKLLDRAQQQSRQEKRWAAEKAALKQLPNSSANPRLWLILVNVAFFLGLVIMLVRRRQAARGSTPTQDGFPKSS